MKFLNGGNVLRLPLDQIEVTGRLREVRESFVENLILMAEDTGITTPIHVRRVKGRHVLIDGAHRLEAARRLGLPDIATLVVECRADEARAMEASNNLGQAGMTPVQRAVFVASWKRDYYAIHPERKPGVFKGNRHTGNLVTDKMSLTRSIADAFGVDERTAYRALRAGDTLTADEAARLDAAPRRVSMKDLQALARIGEPEERAFVVDALASDEKVKNVAAARKWFAAQAAGVPIPEKDPGEARLNDLLKAWKRAGMGERRRFVRAVFDDLSPIVVDEASERDDAEIAALRTDMRGGLG